MSIDPHSILALHEQASTLPWSWADGDRDNLSAILAPDGMVAGWDPDSDGDYLPSAEDRAYILAAMNGAPAMARRILDLEGRVTELLAEFEDLAWQACGRSDPGGANARLESDASRTYADAIRLLARHGRVRITRENGRIVVAEAIEQEAKP